MTEDLTIRELRPADQDEARRLILAGLQRRWGSLDPARNRDLEDIAMTFRAGCFLVARASAALVATGGLLPVPERCVQIHRLSVAPEWQRRGVGSRIAHELIRIAQQRGYRRVVLETTETWSDAVAFWRACGFDPVERRDGDLHFSRSLTGRPCE